MIIWVPIYLNEFVDVSDKYDPFGLNIAFLLIFMALLPMFGKIADKIKERYNSNEAYRYMMISGSIMSMILTIPAFLLLQQKSLFAAIIGYFFLIIPLSMYGSVMFIICVEMFEVLDRLTGVGYSYNLSHALWSSSITAVLTALADRKGLTSPAYYLFGISGVSALVTCFGYNWLQEIKKDMDEQTKGSGTSTSSITVVNA